MTNELVNRIISEGWEPTFAQVADETATYYYLHNDQLAIATYHRGSTKTTWDVRPAPRSFR